MDIGKMSPKTRRVLREDGSYINTVDSVTTVHHDNTDQIGYGEIGNINGLKYITIATYGDAIASLNAQMSIDGERWYQKWAFNNYPGDGSNGWTYIDALSIAGWKYLRVQVESISGGTVSVISNAVY